MFAMFSLQLRPYDDIYEFNYDASKLLKDEGI